MICARFKPKTFRNDGLPVTWCVLEEGLKVKVTGCERNGAVKAYVVRDTGTVLVTRPCSGVYTVTMSVNNRLKQRCKKST